jgi:serine protease
MPRASGLPPAAFLVSVEGFEEKHRMSSRAFKHMPHPLAAAAFAAALFVAAPVTPARAGGADPAGVAPHEEATDQLIIKYRAGAAPLLRSDFTSMARAHEAANQAGVQMRLMRLNALQAHVMKLDQRVPLARLNAIAARMAALDPDIEFAEPDRLLQPLLTPNDSRYLEQWHYSEATGGLRANTAWDQASGTGVVVAVLDTGVRPHADLAANLVAGYDMIGDLAVANDGNGRDGDASDPGDWVTAGECGVGSAARNSSWHGTHVAGTIAAVTNNAAGVAGVAFGAKVQPVRVLGKCGGYTSDIADGITWASGGTVSGVPANPTPARVINMSLGGSGSCSTTTQNAVNGARSRGTVVVVAAGNSNLNASNFNPANCAGVVTVAATDRNGAKAYYSNFGAAVDVAAPGGDVRAAATNGVLSTLNSGTTTPGADSYAWYQGTSMATPHVAATVALMLQKNAALTPDQAESLLKSSARAFPGTCSQCGSGIVDANAAVSAAAGGGGGGGGGTVAEVESNNSLSTAQAVSVNPATINGSMSSSTDTDYFRVSVGAGRTLTATLTPPATADYDLYIYNSAGTQVARSILGTGAVDRASVTNTGAAAATYYVRVRYYSGGAGSYTLGLSY